MTVEGGFTNVDDHLLKMMCRAAFEMQIAQVTIEIGKPRVVEIVKDIKVTFPDMLGTIGKQIMYATKEIKRVIV